MKERDKREGVSVVRALNDKPQSLYDNLLWIVWTKVELFENAVHRFVYRDEMNAHKEEGAALLE